MSARSVVMRLFGSPVVEIDGAPIAISRNKTLALLAYLVCSARSFTRDHLAAMFWPESDSSRARGGLRQLLAELNRCLGHDLLVTGNDRVGVDPRAGVRVDVREFQDQCETCLGPDRNLSGSALEEMERSVTMATPEFMEGFSLPDCPAFDEWQFDTRTELRSRLFELTKKLIPLLKRGGEISRALKLARKLVVLDPLDEENQRLLMVLLAQNGDRIAALRQFRLFCWKLREELGAEPDDQTVGLYEQIRRTPLKGSGAADTGDRGLEVRGFDPGRSRRTRLVIAGVAAVAILSVLVAGWAGGWFFYPPRPHRTLAVLPVKPWCGDPEAEGYCEVLTHELITALAAGSALKVNPQASVRQYRNTVKRIPQIARELGVRYVLDTVGYREGDILMFSVHLIHAGRDECIWTEVYSAVASDLVEGKRRIIEEITEQVVDQLL